MKVQVFHRPAKGRSWLDGKGVHYIRLVVEVDGEKIHAVYVKKPFREPPYLAAKGTIYSLADENILNSQ